MNKFYIRIGRNIICVCRDENIARKVKILAEYNISEDIGFCYLDYAKSRGYNIPESLQKFFEEGEE